MSGRPCGVPSLLTTLIISETMIAMISVEKTKRCYARLLLLKSGLDPLVHKYMLAACVFTEFAQITFPDRLYFVCI